MRDNSTAQPPGPGPEHRRLDAFVGIWKTEGEIRASASGPAARFRATDTYEWLPGGFFLVHRFEAQMPDGETQGIEIIGYDAERKTYPMHSFDSQGNASVMQASVEDGTWIFTGEALRFTGSFQDGGNTITGLWEQRSDDGGQWLPWLDVKLTKAGRGSE